MSNSVSSVKYLHAKRDVVSGLQAWVEPVVIPTYPAGPPDPNPMFLEKRVYQGSSGRVYPLPVVDSVATSKEDRVYEALHLENESLYVMLLPEIGGRIHIGYDKTAKYDFFYRQNVIKPALVGLAGPWISGGVEFNWPQHHRPSTFMPCSWSREEHSDGSCTFWMSEHEPMNRMRGMHGVCIRPDSTLIELKARVYNRTPFTQTFLWWANVAARVHEQYQSFFPPDVAFVADHAKRAVSAFPGCSDQYYGVPYGVRARLGLPIGEEPTQFVPSSDLAPNRLDWYVNIPVPTSYMVVSTAYEFFGGYDHSANAGFVHVADRHISPGKKQWTWGNHEFGYAWDRNLTDDGGPYVELMAGVYTDNQPDFSFLAPYETKTFSQFWYPIRDIGPAHNATRHAAVSIHGCRVGVCPSARYPESVVRIEFANGVRSHLLDLAPESPFLATFTEEPLAVTVTDGFGEELVAYDRRTFEAQPVPDSATEPPAPSEVFSTDELYQIGVHLDQYRHATRSPEPYWEEALSRDPGDARCHVALGRRDLGRGLLQAAEEHFRSAIARLTSRNPNPADGEAHYLLGVSLRFQARYAEARNAFGKASWNYSWRGAANLELARLAIRANQVQRAQTYLREASLTLGDASSIRSLEAMLHRRNQAPSLALSAARAVLAYDPLDHWALYEAAQLDPTYDERWRSAMRQDVQNFLDLALEFDACGLDDECATVLALAPGDHPVVRMLCGGRASDAEPLTGVFPNRLEEMLVLERALVADPSDGVASALLGNFYYDRRRYEDAITQWEAAVELRPDDAFSRRNLGIAYHNIRHDAEAARDAYACAMASRPNDGRLVYESDQLAKRTGVEPVVRLAVLEAREDLVEHRDDLTLELCSLYNQTNQPAKALSRLAQRTFTPWEGGEGVALGQYTRAHYLSARAASPVAAVEHLRKALAPPQNLGEARHLLANASDLWVALGDALRETNEREEAENWYRRAADFRGDFQEMSIRTFSEMTYYRALALQRLARDAEAGDLLRGLEAYAEDLEMRPAKIDYFATSLPTMLLFDDDLNTRQVTTARFLRAQAALGLGRTTESVALLHDVLKRDPNHSMAQDLRSSLV